MEILAFLVPWILIGIGVFFVSFSGGPGAAREAYLTRGRRAFGALIVLTYVGIGIAIPAVVIASRGTREGNSSRLSQDTLRAAPGEGTPARCQHQKRRGENPHRQSAKHLFGDGGPPCHNLDAVNARG